MNKSNIINKSLTYLFFVTNITLLSNFFLVSDYTFFFQSKTLIYLIVITFMIPSIQYYFFNKRDLYLPIGEIILIFFLLAYIAIFFYNVDYIQKSYTWMLNDFSISQKKTFFSLLDKDFLYLKYFYLSCISFYIGFVLVSKINIINGFFSNKVEKYYNFSEKDLFFIGSFFLIIKLINFIFPEINNYKFINNFKSITFLFYISCFWTFFLINKKNYLKKIFIILTFFLCFFVDIIETGSQIGITLMFVLMVLIYWLIKKKIFFLGIFLIFFSFYFFQDIKIEYRTSLNNIREDLRKPFFKISNYTNNIYRNLELIKKNELKNKNDVSNVRLTISSYGYYKLIDLNKNNQLILKNGETYQNLFLFIIPRFLWKNKPVSSYGIEFGLVTQITEKEAPTSINVSWISEAFWNFGYLFFIPMIIKGIFVGLISIAVNYRNNSIISIAWLTSAIHLLIPESNFSLMSISFIYQLIFLIIFLTIYKLIFKK
jgi:hypothetical protein